MFKGFTLSEVGISRSLRNCEDDSSKMDDKYKMTDHKKKSALPIHQESLFSENLSSLASKSKKCIPNTLDIATKDKIELEGHVYGEKGKYCCIRAFVEQLPYLKIKAN